MSGKNKSDGHSDNYSDMLALSQWVIEVNGGQMELIGRER
jgi:hypothetical protein